METEKIKEKLKEYYQNCELWIPHKSQWRYYIFKLPNGVFKRFHIKNKTELRKLLIKNRPLIVYYSSGAWLNVQNVRGQLKTTSYPIPIFQDLILDIDNDTSLNMARKSALEIIKRIDKKPDYILLTKRGFHIVYFKQGHKKKEYLEKLKDIKDLDSKCTENKFNVFSLPHTLTKDGKPCIFLTLDELKYIPISFIEGRRKQIYPIPYHTPTNIPEKPEKANEEAVNSKLEVIKSKGLRSRRETKQEREMGTGTTILSFNNQVKQKLFIPILIYDKTFNGLKRELDYLVEHYDLGDLYVFEKENHLCFISLKVMEKRRLMKILNSSRSLNKGEFLKFKRIHFNFSEWKPITKINYESKKYYRISKKHHEALIKMGFPESKQMNEFVGRNQLNVYEVCMS